MGYLEHYGEGVERRLRRTKRAAFSLCMLFASGVILFFVLHNHREERQAQQFFAVLSAQDYPAAYAFWARTEGDRRAYPMQAFLDDWGPRSGRGDPKRFIIPKSRSCGSGVILTIRSGKPQEERLWIERGSLLIGFAPPPDLLPKICGF